MGVIIKATYDPPSIHTRCLARLLMGAGAGEGWGYTDRAGSTSKRTSLPCSTSYTLLESPDCQTPLLLLFICLFLGQPSHGGFWNPGGSFSAQLPLTMQNTRGDWAVGNSAHLHCRSSFDLNVKRLKGKCVFGVKCFAFKFILCRNQEKGVVCILPQI